MKKFLLTALVAASGWLATVPAQAAPVLSIVPTSSSVSVGGSFRANLVISGLTSVSEIVSGFDLDVFFNPAVLAGTSINTVFAPWGTGGDVLFTQDFISAGHVEFTLVALSLDATLAGLQGDSFVLSSIDFVGLADGFSNISYGSDLDLERSVIGRDGIQLNQATTGTCVAVGTGVCLTEVPEPTTLPLVLLALAAGGVAVRRPKQAALQPA